MVVAPSSSGVHAFALVAGDVAAGVVAAGVTVLAGVVVLSDVAVPPQAARTMVNDKAAAAITFVNLFIMCNTLLFVFGTYFFNSPYLLFFVFSKRLLEPLQKGFFEKSPLPFASAFVSVVYCRKLLNF
jgi:hypothetical protein